MGWARSQRSATRRERGGLGTSVWDGVYFHRPRSAFSASDLTSKALNLSSTSRRWRGQCIFTTLPFHADKQQRPTEQWCLRWCPHTLSPPLSALAPDRSCRRGPWHRTPLGIHARDLPPGRLGETGCVRITSSIFLGRKKSKLHEEKYRPLQLGETKGSRFS